MEALHQLLLQQKIDQIGKKLMTYLKEINPSLNWDVIN